MKLRDKRGDKERKSGRKIQTDKERERDTVIQIEIQTHIQTNIIKDWEKTIRDER